MTDIQTKAQELATLVMDQITAERTALAELMLDMGWTDESHVICDNVLDVINDPTVPYKCWAVFKPRFNRALTGE